VAAIRTREDNNSKPWFTCVMHLGLLNVLDRKRIIFHNGIRKQLLTSFFRNSFSFFLCDAIQFHLDNFSDSDLLDLDEIKALQSMVNRLALRVEDRFL
jgi:hypothetical protein